MALISGIYHATRYGKRKAQGKLPVPADIRRIFRDYSDYREERDKERANERAISRDDQQCGRVIPARDNRKRVFPEPPDYAAKAVARWKYASTQVALARRAKLAARESLDDTLAKMRAQRDVVVYRLWAARHRKPN